MSALNQILVPTDFSDFSQAALDYACALAEPAGATLHLLHVVRDRRHDSHDAQVQEGLEQLGGLLQARQELAIKTIKRVMTGEASRVISNYAQEHKIDMIVMGTHGRTGLAHLTLGSVAERVLRDSVCPVVVLGPKDTSPTALVRRADAVIRKVHGDGLTASYEEGLRILGSTLATELGVTRSTGDGLLVELQRFRSLIWTAGDPGHWATKSANLEEVEAPDEPRSQAVDLIERARHLRATDVHIDPADAGEVRVRLRIDGKLEPYCELDERVAEHLINQFKTLARLDIAEPFLPQEGRLHLPPKLRDIEVRVTSAPVAAGHAMALRLFARENIYRPLDDLGFTDYVSNHVHEMLRRGEGLVLITGPTGAGKTTTVYSMLESLGSIDRNVVSIEDPVEFSVPFVRQMNVDEKHDITITTGLRTILRMDPDVVFVGEVRDAEAADIAMRAASSGKYVLTTLHTRDVVSTITALRDMGIADRSLAGNLTGIINQRLVRRLCTQCKKAAPISPEERRHFEEHGVEPPQEVFHPVGCAACRDTGYLNRVGVFEAAVMNADFAHAIAEGEGEAALRDRLRQSGIPSLQTQALDTVVEGLTNLEEALSVHWLD